MLSYSVVRGGLRAAVCSDERPCVTHPTLADAGQHPARSDDVLRHHADRAHPQPVLARRRDRRRPAAVQHSILAEHVLQRRRHYYRHQLLDHDISLSRRSTSRHLLPDTGKHRCHAVLASLIFSSQGQSHVVPGLMN